MSWHIDHPPSATDPQFTSQYRASADITGALVFVSPTGNDTQGALGKSAFATIGAAITALPANGGTIVTLLGEYAETVVLPARPKVINLMGDGTLIPPSANTPVMTAVAGSDSHQVKLKVTPHASGSTGAAIEMNGMRNCTLDITSVANSSAKFAIGFKMGGANGCYNNHLKITHQQCTGPTTLVKCYNEGTNATNPNVNYIDDPWIYANASITTIFDLAESTLFEIRGGGIESNTGATVLIPGQFTKARGGWWEANATASIAPRASGVGTVDPKGVSLEDIYFSGAQTCTIPSGIEDWSVLNCHGSMVFTDAGSGSIAWGGNTGWRAISTWDAAGTVTGATLTNAAPTSGQAGGIWTRRINNTVELMVQYLTTSATSAQLAWPAGFRRGSGPSSSLGGYAAAPLSLGSTTGSTLSAGFGSSTTVLNINGPITAIILGYATWLTSDVWPATLPGTAA